MRFKNYSGLMLLAALGWTSCISPPDNYPSVPEIQFSSIEYSGDSLIISVGFKDAEGDLGLSATDVDPPFHPLTFLRDGAGNLITYSNRPPEAPSYNPIDWEVNPLVNNMEVNDTIWVEQNDNHYNIFVRFYIKRNGQFTEFRWQDPPLYTTLNGRFPRILTTTEGQAVEGNIKYRMYSSGWESIFRTDTLRIDVEVQDRALNRSNQVSSPEVTLRQISRN